MFYAYLQQITDVTTFVKKQEIISYHSVKGVKTIRFLEET